jgi:hypothetical protein
LATSGDRYLAVDNPTDAEAGARAFLAGEAAGAPGPAPRKATHEARDHPLPQRLVHERPT